MTAEEGPTGAASTGDAAALNDPDLDDKREGETDDDAKNRKRKERLEQNRISARESRKRKKTMIEELQRTVITLSRENKELNERNEQLRRQLMEIGTKVRSFVVSIVSLISLIKSVARKKAYAECHLVFLQAPWARDAIYCVTLKV